MRTFLKIALLSLLFTALGALAQTRRRSGRPIPSP